MGSVSQAHSSCLLIVATSLDLYFLILWFSDYSVAVLQFHLNVGKGLKKERTISSFFEIPVPLNRRYTSIWDVFSIAASVASFHVTLGFLELLFWIWVQEFPSSVKLEPECFPQNFLSVSLLYFRIIFMCEDRRILSHLGYYTSDVVDSGNSWCLPCTFSLSP